MSRKKDNTSPSSGQIPVEMINTDDALAAFCRAVRKEDFIALDTEFMREKTYFPQLCLLQAATTTRIACIDPVAVHNLEPLYEILFDTTILKVFHSGGQDLELIYHLTGKLPRPVFDTQIAAAMLGEGEQVGYANLVNAMLKVELDKSQTRTDWCKRPLTRAQIEYAADDVRHLVTIYQRQRKILSDKGRLEWLEPDFRQLSDPAQFELSADALLKRVKGTQRLEPQQQAITRSLAEWREAVARQRNKPRKWILADNVILDLAKRPPETVDDLADYRGLSPGQIKNSGEKILEAVQAARQLPPAQWPTQTKRKKPDATQTAIIDAILVLLKLIGSEHDIAASTLSGRAQIEKLVSGDRDIPLMRGWRYELAGRAVENFLQGKTVLTITNDRLDCVKK